MDTETHFSQPRSLQSFLEELGELPSWMWLYVSEDEERITLSSLCLSTLQDSRELSDEEHDERESAAGKAGIVSFFCRDQLEDIIGNLQAQRSDFSDDQLEKAIQYYWDHDAYIQMA